MDKPKQRQSVDPTNEPMRRDFDGQHRPQRASPGRADLGLAKAAGMGPEQSKEFDSNLNEITSFHDWLARQWHV